MSYTSLPGDDANFSWVGAPAYTPSAGDAANATWQPVGGAALVTGTGAAQLSLIASGVAVHGVSGVGTSELAVTASGAGKHATTTSVGSGAAQIDLTASGKGAHGVSGTAATAVPVNATGLAAHGVAGSAAIAINCTGSGAGGHGVGGSATSAITCRVSGTGVHERYELRGEVREGGVLVNRRVRAYLRSTGALTGQADTVVGKFNIAAGFSLAEHYITPIDLSDTAADWLPPTANRIIPVLAQDTA